MSTPLIEWKPGEMARLAVVGGPRWVYILSIENGSVSYLNELCGVGYCPIRSLLTREGYLAHCEYMRDDWTGREYREYVAMADRPFVPPDSWAESLARAKGEIA